MIVQIRPFQSADLSELVKYANNPNVANNMTDMFPNPYTEKDGKQFLERVTAQQPTQVFAITANNQFCGAIGIHPQGDIMRMNAELGYWLAEPFWGKEITLKAIQQIVPYGFEHFSINRIFARPFGSNSASQRVLEKAGFTLEARFEKTIVKNQQLLDELVYAIRRTDSTRTK